MLIKKNNNTEQNSTAKIVGKPERLAMYNAASPLHTDLQVVNIQRCERTFACPITCLVYTLMCTHRLQAAVNPPLPYSTLWSGLPSQLSW